MIAHTIKILVQVVVVIAMIKLIKDNLMIAR
jgi:hypothetical protein